LAIRNALLLCIAATLLHHVHNAEFLEHYPSLPAWISRGSVYAAWLGAALVGLAGYSLRKRAAGTMLLVLYGAYALGGLVHYALAPISAHSFAMNLSIWLEAAAGAALLFATVKGMPHPAAV
jgi:hypothetical protein